MSTTFTQTLFKDSTCSKLKAVRQQQMVKFANTKFSGVVATQCARHSFYLPQGMVNLVKGEAYVNSIAPLTVPDYAIDASAQILHSVVHSEQKHCFSVGSW